MLRWGKKINKVCATGCNPQHTPTLTKGLTVNIRCIPPYAGLPSVFIEEGSRFGRRFLPDREYAIAQQGFIKMCVDAVVVNTARRTFFLPKRQVKPMQGYWIIGGKRI